MSRAPSASAWIAAQLVAAEMRIEGESAPVVHNPRPPGRIVPGSATDAVRDWLRSRPSRAAWWSMHQIISGTGRSGKACCWAVVYLHRMGELERSRHENNTRYLRYRLRVK